MREYDLIVIGAGPGGYTAAAVGAQHGLKTLLVEKDLSGGTCLNRGCIPTKALLYCAERFDEATHGAAFGVTVSGAHFDYAKAAAHRDATVKRLRTGVDFFLKRAGVERLAGDAQIVDSSHIAVGGEMIAFGHLILATGSIPAPYPFAHDAEANLINSDGFLALADAPERIVIIGGGVIGLEFATILAKIGRKVTVVEAFERVLPPLDAELAKIVRRSLEKSGVEFHTSAFVKKVSRRDEKTVCDVTACEESFALEADLVLCAVGRIAATQSLCLKRANIAMRKSFVRVDDRCMTTCPHIYAVGDVNGAVMLAHAATYQGEKVAKNIAHGTALPVLDAPVPSCVYTDPELASVGLTEEEAKRIGRAVKIGRVEALANGKMLTAGVREGFVKIIADAQSGALLGAQMATPRATDGIAEIVAAMKFHATGSELADAIHPHPTISEMVADAARGI